MPFCSGLGNLVFAGVMARHPGNGNDVVVNCLFNNITNLTLLIALPVLIWGMTKIPLKKGKNAMREHQIGRLSLSLNLIAALFFSLFLWLLSSDGILTSSDGFILIALFFFWQCFHIYDVKKTNLLKTQTYPKSLPFEVILLLVGAGFIFHQHRLVGRMVSATSKSTRQCNLPQTTRLGKWCLNGSTQCASCLLLRGSKTNGYCLHFTIRRCPHLHSPEHRNLRHFPSYYCRNLSTSIPARTHCPLPCAPALRCYSRPTSPPSLPSPSSSLLASSSGSASPKKNRSY